MRKQNVIGDRLYNLRMKIGLTQEELSKRTNISKSHISNTENGTKLPSIEMLTILCEFHGLTLAEFFVDDGMLIDLTEKQRDFIKLSGSLSEEQMEGLNTLLRGICNNEKNR